MCRFDYVFIDTKKVLGLKTVSIHFCMGVEKEHYFCYCLIRRSCDYADKLYTFSILKKEISCLKTYVIA
jgi:hypothetical protein